MTEIRRWAVVDAATQERHIIEYQPKTRLWKCTLCGAGVGLACPHTVSVIVHCSKVSALVESEIRLVETGETDETKH